ncbi:hypothetical protein Asera_39300 [Actinocatenispora sera]|uniref:Uncharacterized protein n=1 Tax=Actinocatenispora sera TaxID=390989 RepID=A0A810L5B2_9ACTN|nr:hypothetical protein Asera_39300 [Actinocatenispora sera]
MEYVIASSSESVVQMCREMLGFLAGVSFRMGSIPETGFDCDAAILNSPLGHERYGGTPQIGHVQTLINRRDDGAPAVILAAAPIRADVAAAEPSDAEIESHVQGVIESCISAFRSKFPNRGEEARILLHLEGAGIDRRDIKVPLRGVLRFLEDS